MRISILVLILSLSTYCSSASETADVVDKVVDIVDDDILKELGIDTSPEATRKAKEDLKELEREYKERKEKEEKDKKDKLSSLQVRLTIISNKASQNNHTTIHREDRAQSNCSQMAVKWLNPLITSSQDFPIITNQYPSLITHPIQSHTRLPSHWMSAQMMMPTNTAPRATIWATASQVRKEGGPKG